MRHVLVVEDNPQNAALVVGLLDIVYSDGVIASTAGTVTDGLHKLSAERYDLLVLDLLLGESQPEQTIKDFSTYMRSMPCIVISGFCNEPTIKMAKLAGADCCIPKAELSVAFLEMATRLAELEFLVHQMAHVAFDSKKVVGGT